MTPEEEFSLEVLDLIASKIKNGGCTKEQSDAIYNITVENLPVWATADEIANHFGKTRDAVHSVIKNRMFTKPKRNVTLYNFKEFCKRLPSSWRKKH
jgi:hypothetical protein